ncbi:MAG: acyltransferase, partial [Planctomycetota bacterium]
QKFRIANVERLRILAIFGIIWFHTEGAFGRSVGYAGLPVFIMIFCALSSRKSIPDDFASFARKKARRLLKPWLFWSIVYVVCKVLKQSLFDADVSESFAGFSILVGPRIHLWYLPFAFACGLVVNLLHRRAMRVSSAVTVLVATIVGVLCVFFCSLTMSSTKLPVPVPQWLFGLPGIPLGFAVGRVCYSLKGGLQKKFCFGIILAVEGVCLLLFRLGYTYLVVQYAIAIVLVCIAFMSTGRSGAQLLKFSSLAYGIYLVHPLVGSVLYAAGIRAVDPLLMVFVIFLISSATTLILQKTPLRQFV